MSLYSQYLKEICSRECLETEYGFLSFGLYGDECSVFDGYVIPEMRRRGVWSKMLQGVEGIARKAGCKFITASVLKTQNNPKPGFGVLTKNGYTPCLSNNELIILKKDL